MKSGQTLCAHYLSQVHQVSNLIFKSVPVFTVVLQDEVLSKTTTIKTTQHLNKTFSWLVVGECSPAVTFR